MKEYIISQEVMNYLENKYPNAWATIMHDTQTDIQEKKDYRIYTDYKNSSRNIGREKRYAILKKQNWKCNICACQLKYNKNSEWEGEIAHIDHIFPYSKRKDYPNGITQISELSNLQALCPKCNLSKSKKEIQ